MNIFFTKHSIQRMFERDITEEDIEYAISNGDIIATYPNDKPYPSVLIYCRVKNKPLHVVYSVDDSNKDGRLFYVITVYRPTLEEWYNDFKTRRN